jgi:hypothetical protein
MRVRFGGSSSASSGRSADVPDPHALRCSAGFVLRSAVPGVTDRAGSRQWIGLATAVPVFLLLAGVVARERERLIEPIVVAGQRLDQHALRAGGVNHLPATGVIARHEHVMPGPRRAVAAANPCRRHRSATRHVNEASAAVEFARRVAHGAGEAAGSLDSDSAQHAPRVTAAAAIRLRAVARSPSQRSTWIADVPTRAAISPDVTVGSRRCSSRKRCRSGSFSI